MYSLRYAVYIHIVHVHISTAVFESPLIFYFDTRLAEPMGPRRKRVDRFWCDFGFMMRLCVSKQV